MIAFTAVLIRDRYITDDDDRKEVEHVLVQLPVGEFFVSYLQQIISGTLKEQTHEEL